MNLPDLLKDKTFRTTLIIGLVCGAISYWFQPYNERNLLGMDIYLLMGILAFTASALAMVINRGIWYQIPLFLGAGFLISVMGRIFYDVTFIDKTHHNLWPFEILFVLGIIVPTSFTGGFLAFLLKKTIK